jgi:elongation factor P
MAALGITELKKGTIFELNGTLYKVLEYSQKVMGRGGSIVNVKIKSLSDGKVLEKTFKGNEQLESADISNRKGQFLYKDSSGYHFMDSENYEQFNLPTSDTEDITKFVKEGGEVTIQTYDGKAINVELPKNVPLKVTYTEDVVRGNTAIAITKDATVETGLVVKVPAFIKQGDVISVDTSTRSYRERVKD